MLPDVNGTAVVAVDFVYDSCCTFFAHWVLRFLKKLCDSAEGLVRYLGVVFA